MKMNRVVWMISALLSLIAVACVEEDDVVNYGLFPPQWIQSPELDVSVRGEFRVIQGKVDASPEAQISYYYASAGTNAPVDGENGESAWTDVGWMPIADINEPVRGLSKGTYLVCAVAENTQGMIRSPIVQAAVVDAFPPTQWLEDPQVDASNEVKGKFTIIPGKADGDPSPEYSYYLARVDSNLSPPEDGKDKQQDWISQGWTYIDQQNGLIGIEAEAFDYNLYVVAMNNSNKGIRTESINFEVSGYAPVWELDNTLTPDPVIFGRFRIEPGRVSANPSPTIMYYFMKRGAVPPAENSIKNWQQNVDLAYSYSSIDIENNDWKLTVKPGFYDVYVVATNRLEPPARQGPIELSLPYLDKTFVAVQAGTPTDWQNATNDTPSPFGTAIHLENGNTVLTGGVYENSYISSDGGTTWIKQSKISNLQNIYWGTLVEHNDRIYHLGGAVGDDADSENYSNAVYESTDGGITFSKLYDASWPGRGSLTALSYDGKIWVMGGYSDQRTDTMKATRVGMADVWYTDNIDENVWTEAPSPPWDDIPEEVEESARNRYGAYGASGVVYDGKMYFGGGSQTNENNQKLWTSTDGVNWELVPILLTMVPYESTATLSMFVYKNRLFLWSLNNNRNVIKNSDGVILSEPGAELHYLDFENSRAINVFGVERVSHLGTFCAPSQGSASAIPHYLSRWNRIYAYGWGDGPQGGIDGIRIVTLSYQHGYIPPNPLHVGFTDDTPYLAFGIKWIDQPEN